jgi:uncharacterized membrane protein YfcA
MKRLVLWTLLVFGITNVIAGLGALIILVAFRNSPDFLLISSYISILMCSTMVWLFILELTLLAHTNTKNRYRLPIGWTILLIGICSTAGSAYGIYQSPIFILSTFFGCIVIVIGAWLLTILKKERHNP